MLNVWIFVKIFFLVGLGVYIGFATVVLRQVQLMKDTVHLGLEGLITAVAWIHFIFSIVIFILALILL
jgi:hypothetical protein